MDAADRFFLFVTVSIFVLIALGVVVALVV